MSNLIIVDDEAYIVKIIEESINWKRIGIEQVFTAFNMRQAKEVLSNNRIDIMLCDIEMPQGSGLELLSWVKENYPGIESIFLTCHADFKYAKEAIRLGSFDYILKPVPFDELEAVVSKAINKINQETKIKEFSAFGQFWFKHQPIMIERFWMDILDHAIPSNAQDIKNEAEHRNIPYSEHIKVMPVLVGVHRWHQQLELQDEKIMEFGLKNIAEELLAKEGERGRFYPIQKGCLLGILTISDSQENSKKQLEEDCSCYIDTCRKYLNCDLSCYIGDEVFSHQLAVTVEKLLVLKKNNVAFYNKVLSLNTHVLCNSIISTEKVNVWSVMLKEGSGCKIIAEVEKYLVHMAMTTGLNVNMLYNFHQDFIQMVYSELEQKGIQAHQLFGDDKSLELHIRATNSLMDMMDWIRHILQKSQEYSEEVNESQSIVNRVKKYIKLNLDKELTREDIASYVYLNADYMDIIFKRETGKSTAKFILRERLAIAQELLLKTDIPVSTIAGTVGYNNIPKFSSMFKKMCSVSPIEYRRRSTNNTEKNKVEFG
jgi:two-component system response regulator YesN